MKKLLSVLLVLMLSVSLFAGVSFAADVVASGTDYTATIVLTTEDAFSPNDRATINGDATTYTLSADGKTMTMQKTYEFKDSGYSGIY